MTRPKRVIARVRDGAVLVVLGIAAGCSSYQFNYPRVASYALRAPAATKISRFYEAVASQHPGESGVDYIRYGRVAFDLRITLADLAERSLDLQYYIWDADITGNLLAERVVRAAERGVRVRILLDDHSVVGRDAAIAQLSGHPNIEIRAFNPFRDRSHLGDVFTDAARINRRSHNKVFVADGAVAIVGGRNIADHYFGAHGESNYRDLDVTAVGAVVPEISRAFDAFWNSKFAVPYAAFVATPPTPADAEAMIARLRARVANQPRPYPIDDDISGLLVDAEAARDRLVWAPARVLFDDPAKAEDTSIRGVVGELAALIASAEREVLIENAYFVPGERSAEKAAALTRRGVRIRVLTNSMASNDVAAVCAGYKRYRDDLIKAGVDIYELRPDAAAKARWSWLSAKSRAGLHTKAMVVDRAHTVIGSFNFDPRSANINTELALLIDSAEFGQRVGAYLDDGIRPENSFRVTLEGGSLRWTTEVAGHSVVYTQEPETGWWRRFTVGLIGLLPIQSQI